MGMTEEKNTPPPKTDLNRREFLKSLAGVGGAAVAIQALDQLSLNPEQALASYENQIQQLIYDEGTNLEALDVLERMRVELLRASKKRHRNGAG